MEKVDADGPYFGSKLPENYVQDLEQKLIYTQGGHTKCVKLIWFS